VEQQDDLLGTALYINLISKGKFPAACSENSI